MPLTTRTITTEVHRLECNHCDMVIEAMCLGTLAQLAEAQGWSLVAPLPHFRPLVDAECPTCRNVE